MGRSSSLVGAGESQRTSIDRRQQTAAGARLLLVYRLSRGGLGHVCLRPTWVGLVLMDHGWRALNKSKAPSWSPAVGGVVTKAHCAGPAGRHRWKGIPSTGPGLGHPSAGHRRAETGSLKAQTGFPNLSRHTSRPPSLPLPAPKYPPLATTALCESNETRTSISGGKRQPRAAFFSCHGPSNISLPSPVQFCVLSRSETLVSLLPSVRRRLPPSQRPPPSPSLHRQSRPRNQNSWQTGM